MNALKIFANSYRGSVLGRIFEILGPKERTTAGYVFVGMLAGTLFEALTVGAIVPAMMMFTGGAAGGALPMVPEAFRNRLGQIGESVGSDAVVLYAFGGLLAVFAVKAVFLIALAWQQARFLADIRQDVATRLAELYLRQPWTFHLQRNSAQLIRNCTTEVIMFMSGCSSTLSLCTEVCVVSGIALLLIIVEPAATMFVGVFLFVATWLLQVVLGSRLKRWGEQRQSAEELRVKWLQQGLGGVREVKVYGQEAEFLRHFNAAERSASRATRMSDFTNRVPRVWYELLAVAGVSLVGITLYITGATAISMVPRLGLFVVAAFRLLPSMNRIISAMHSVQFMEPSIDVLRAELALPAAASGGRTPNMLPFEREICLDNVSFSYPAATEPAVRNVSFVIPFGVSAGIIGESGAGKSTLVDLLLGLLTPDEGSITVDDVPIASELRIWQNSIGYVPQSIFLIDDTIRANVAFGVPSDQVDDDSVRRALQAAQLEDFVARLPEGVRTVIGERGVRLSGGQRQRIGIARALYWDPPILFLDEATSALDTETESQVMAGVEALHGKKTIIIIAHRLSTVRHCDVRFNLKRGQLLTSSWAPVPSE